MSPRRPGLRAVALLLFLLLAGSALQSQAAPMTGELRCHCTRTTAHVIPVRHIASVNLISEGPHCASSQVIATMKDGKEVCLDPTANWVKLMVNKMLVNRNTSKL